MGRTTLKFSGESNEILDWMYPERDLVSEMFYMRHRINRDRNKTLFGKEIVVTNFGNRDTLRIFYGLSEYVYSYLVFYMLRHKYELLLFLAPSFSLVVFSYHCDIVRRCLWSIWEAGV